MTQRVHSRLLTKAFLSIIQCFNVFHFTHFGLFKVIRKTMSKTFCVYRCLLPFKIGCFSFWYKKKKKIHIAQPRHLHVFGFNSWLRKKVCQPNVSWSNVSRLCSMLRSFICIIYKSFENGWCCNNWGFKGNSQWKFIKMGKKRRKLLL